MIRPVRLALEIVLAVYVLGLLGLAAAAYLAPGFGFGLYAVRSASMSPAIQVGDLIVEERVDPAVIREGDVITLDTGRGATVTHRVQSVTPNDSGPYFGTKGDANALPDPVATLAGQVRGRVVGDVRLLGFVLLVLSVPSGLLALFSIGASILVGILVLGEGETRREDEVLAELARELGAAPAPSR